MSIKVYVICCYPRVAEAVQGEVTRRGLGGIEVVNYPLATKGTSMVPGMPFRLIDDEEFMTKEADNIEYVIGDMKVLIQLLSRPTNKIKYAQNTYAGVEHFFHARDSITLRPDFKLLRFKGHASRQMIGEYVLGAILERERKFTMMRDNQREHKYDRRPVTPFRTLDTLSVGVLGVGHMGKEILRLCKAFRATTWAAVRDGKEGEAVQHADHVVHMSRLADLLSGVDYLVNVLPSTPATRDLLSGGVLQPCQNKNTVFINVGRGDIIDDDSLIHAVRQGWLGGAILDVFNQEPLPSDSPLWELPGVNISPHCSCCFIHAQAWATDYVDNLECVVKGRPLAHAVNLGRGY